MRIAIFTDTYPPFINGVSTSTYNLVQVLKQHGHDVLVVVPRTDDGKLEYNDGIIKIPGIEMKKVYGYRVTSLYNSKVLKWVKEFKPDILHNQTDFTIGQFANIVARRLNVPQVYTYHTAYEDYTHYVVRGLMDRIGKKALRGYTKTIANNCQGFITPSGKTKEYMRSIGSDIYISVVPTGIDFSLFDDDKVDHERMKKFKEEHGIKESTKTFLLLGRVAKEKSMDYSIRGFAMYAKKHPEMDVKMIFLSRHVLIISIATALTALREGARNYETLFDFLPERFTLTALQKVQETVMNIQILPANFRRKVSDYVVETDEYTQGAGHRPGLAQFKQVCHVILFEYCLGFRSYIQRTAFHLFQVYAKHVCTHATSPQAAVFADDDIPEKMYIHN